jgi:hypothetical protein
MNQPLKRTSRNVKCEEIYLKSYRTVWEAEEGIGAWFGLYNRQPARQCREGVENACQGRTADAYSRPRKKSAL